MSQPQKLDFSEKFRTLRNRLKMTQEELGQRLGVTGNYIYLIEAGKEPSDRLLKSLEVFEQSTSGPLELRESAGPPMAAIYSKLETRTLLHSLKDIADKLPKADRFELKIMLANIQAILDELQGRDLGRTTAAIPGVSPKVSNAALTTRGVAAGLAGSPSAGTPEHPQSGTTVSPSGSKRGQEPGARKGSNDKSANQ